MIVRMETDQSVDLDGIIVVGGGFDESVCVT
jgi:hypothetical protein